MTKEILFLKENILKNVIRDKYDNSVFKDNCTQNWIFDFRAVLLKPEILVLITSVLWEKIKHRDNFQIGGIESAAIPLITSLVLKAHQEGKNVNGFYIRKSRKKSGLHKHIEGELTDDPVILVDDLMNTSESFMRQITILEEAKKQIDEILILVRFRDSEYYTFLQDRNIKVENIFVLDDFNLSLVTEKISLKQYRKKLLFTDNKANYQYICPKSTPVIDESGIYLGTDQGRFLKLDKESGEVKWEIKTGLHDEEKNIFSSPVLYRDIVLFGSYDGKLYAVSSITGALKWIYTDCEYIGSSPSIASELNLVFVGLEHSLLGERGSIVALDINTGEKKWEYRTPAFTHSSPLYIPETQEVCIGGNEGVLRMFDAQTGTLKWQFETEGGATYSGIAGFSKGDIKLSPAYDENNDTITCCSMDGWLYVLERSTGTLRYRIPSEKTETNYRIGIFNQPLITEKYILFGGLDKHVYCCEKESGSLVWRFATAGRIFASPIKVHEQIFIGSNDGGLYEINIETGELLSRTQFSERLTNKCVYDILKDTLYVFTHGNQLYSLSLSK